MENQNDELYSNIYTESNVLNNTNNNITKNDNFVQNRSYVPKNTEIITNNNQNQEINTNINNLEQNNNLYESIQANQNNNFNEIIETKNIENYPSPYSNYNLNNYPSFVPKQIESTNILNNNFKVFQEDANKNQYSHIFNNIDTRIGNNPSELNKIFNMIDNSKNYQQDLKEPVLSDEEVDIILKDEAKKVTQRNVYNRNGLYQNLLLTPDRKKVNDYPLTPDHQNQRQKFIINPQKNYQNNNFMPIRRNITPDQIKYQNPRKVIKTNGKNYYLIPPDKLPDKHTIIKIH